jgi:hypothetical protein
MVMLEVIDDNCAKKKKKKKKKKVRGCPRPRSEAPRFRFIGA